MRAGELVTKGADAPLKNGEPEGSDAPLKGSSPTSQFSMVEMRYGKEGLKIKLPSLSGWLLKKHARKGLLGAEQWGRRHFVVDDDAGTLAYAKDEKKRGADSVTLALVEIARVHELAGEVAPRKWSRHHDADGAPFEVVWAGGRLVLRAEDREERTMWVRGLQRRIAERRGRAAGHPAEALASPRTADGEKTNTDESTASDDGSTTTSASHANAPAASPTRLARYDEDDDAARQQDEPRMSPVTEVVAAQSPDARRPPPAAAWGSDRASSEVLEMSSPDALSEF
jgi:hypothetical protein